MIPLPVKVKDSRACGLGLGEGGGSESMVLFGNVVFERPVIVPSGTVGLEGAIQSSGKRCGLEIQTWDALALK